MARAIKFQLKFSSVKDDLYTLNIYEDGYAGTPIPLIGASSPFYTEEEEDEDIFIPIRIQTGCMTLIADENTDSLIPADNYAHYVTLDSGGAILWQGFMIPQSFSQPWDAKPYEIDFQVQSPISLLSSKQMDMSKGLGSISLRDLIIEAFTECGISDLYDTFSTDDYTASSITNLLAYRVSRFNWFEENKTEDDLSGDWKKFVGKSYYTMIKDVLSFLGLTMRERGRTIYLKAIDAWTYRYDKSRTSTLSMPFTDFLAKTGTWRRTTYNAIGFDSIISPASTKNTIDIVPGRNKITITANTNKVGELLNNFKITSYDVVDQKTYYLTFEVETVYDPADAYYFFKCRLRSNICIGNDVTCHVYGYNSGNLVEIAYPTAVDRQLLGCTIMDVDLYTSNNIAAGKDNYSYDSGLFNRFIEVIQWQTGATPQKGWDELVAMSISSTVTANYINGYLCLSGSTQFYDELCRQKRIGQGYFTFGIRIGDKYWNGSAWTTLPSTFLVKHGQKDCVNWFDIGSGEILSTKTLEMDCNASGYMIPVNTELSGEIEIRLISSFQFIQEHSFEGGFFMPDYLYGILKDLSLEYFSPDTESFNSNTVNTYAKIVNKSFNDDKSVSLNIATSQNNKDGYAVLKNNTIPVTFLQYNINNNVNWFRPEEFLLDRMVKHYHDNVKYLTIDTVFPHEVIVNKKLKDSNNVLWAPISESHSWAENICKYKLITINDK